jgi:hypothetical protein
MRSTIWAVDATQESVHGADRYDDRMPDYADGHGVPSSTGPLKEIEAGACGDITESFRAINVMDSSLTSEEEEEETRKRRGGGLVLPRKSADPAVVKRSSSLKLRSTAQTMDNQNWQQPGWSDSE